MKIQLRRPCPRQTPGISHHPRGHIDGDGQLCNGHGKPDGAWRRDSGQHQNENAADHSASGYGYHEGGRRLHKRLEIIGGEDVQREQQEGKPIAADDGGRDF